MRKPFYKLSHEAWYVKTKDGIVRLGKTEVEAYTRWAELKAGKTLGITLGKLIDKYVAWCKREKSPETVKSYCRILTRWTKHHAGMCAAEIRPLHLDELITLEFSHCGKSTHWQVKKVASVLFTWGNREGHLDTNPLQGMKRGSCGVRTLWIKQEEFDTLLAATDDPLLKDLLVTLWDTGARPHEIFMAEARHLDRDARCLRYAKGKGGKPRVVYLTPRAFDLCCRLADRHPAGAIFRNSLDRPWSATLISHRLRVLKGRTGIKMTAYAFRHSFATRGILNGVDLKTLSELLGHSSLEMLSRVYAHIGGQTDHLHGALAKLG